MNIFSKAANYQPLSPTARAFIKLLEGAGAAILVAALPVLSTALSSGTLSLSSVKSNLLPALLTVALLALLKYCKAQGDPLIGDLLGTAATAATPTTTPPTSAPVATPTPPAVTPAVNISAVPNLTGGVPPVQTATVTQPS